MTILRQRMIEDLRIRNYSDRTIPLYVNRVAKFAQYFGRSPHLLGPAEIRQYQVFLTKKKNRSWSEFKQTVCALRFFYRVCLNQEWIIEHIPFPRPEKKLPVILSLQEIDRFFEGIGNLKHRTLLLTIYATGLRISEALHLHLEDIDSARRLVRVRQGKGHKDRYVPLSETLLRQLRTYWKEDRPGPWLFPGADSQRPLGVRSVQRVCQRAAAKAALSKGVTPPPTSPLFRDPSARSRDRSEDDPSAARAPVSEHDFGLFARGGGFDFSDTRSAQSGAQRSGSVDERTSARGSRCLSQLPRRLLPGLSHFRATAPSLPSSLCLPDRRLGRAPQTVRSMRV